MPAVVSSPAARRARNLLYYGSVLYSTPAWLRFAPWIYSYGHANPAGRTAIASFRKIALYDCVSAQLASFELRARIGFVRQIGFVS
jgi:hypothetical protein